VLGQDWARGAKLRQRDHPPIPGPREVTAVWHGNGLSPRGRNDFPTPVPAAGPPPGRPRPGLAGTAAGRVLRPSCTARVSRR
jgi:hypothetical protein